MRQTGSPCEPRWNSGHSGSEEVINGRRSSLQRFGLRCSASNAATAALDTDWRLKLLSSYFHTTQWLCQALPSHRKLEHQGKIQWLEAVSSRNAAVEGGTVVISIFITTHSHRAAISSFRYAREAQWDHRDLLSLFIVDILFLTKMVQLSLSTNRA